MLKGGDMLVNLMHLPEYHLDENLKMKRAFAGDKGTIMQFIRENFQDNWQYEVEHALMQEVSKCYIVTEKGKILGFACFDASARGFFGPIGVLESERGRDIGTALLIQTLQSMKEYGYIYGIIGWVDSAADFYQKTVGAEYIKNGNPENSVYSNLVFM